jgi:hypothetical protein
VEFSKHIVLWAAQLFIAKNYLKNIKLL